MHVILCALLGVGFYSVNAYQGDSDECQKKLDGLVVTWAPANVKRPLAFSHLPRTVNGALIQNWEFLDDGCKNSSLGHKGLRFILDDDPAVLILYDKRGHVAGLQTTISKALADSGGIVNYENSPYLYYEKIKEQDRYVMTFYFVDPNDVCQGRSESQFTEDGTIKQFHIKKGPNSYFKPPLTQNSTELSAQNWDMGRCVDTMGLHYFNDYPKDMTCPDIKPYFLLYDCGRLIGTGMFVIGNFTEDLRFEYVAKAALPGSFETVPDCLNEMYGPHPGGITSMHVFFTNDPSKIVCKK